jgi:hypothetical protein
MSEPPRQGLFPFPFPPHSGWLVAFFEAGAGRRVALMITGNPYDPAEDDAVVADAFASYASWAPGAAVAHDVLCLHVLDRRSRALRVGAGAAPTVGELAAALRAVEQKRATVNVSQDRQQCYCSNDYPPGIDEWLTAIVRQIGACISEIHSSGVVAAPAAPAPAAPSGTQP